MMLEDETGQVSQILCPKLLATYRKEALAAALLVVYGLWQTDRTVRHLIARSSSTGSSCSGHGQRLRESFVSPFLRSKLQPSFTMIVSLTGGKPGDQRPVEIEERVAMLITTRQVGTKAMKIFRRDKFNYFTNNFNITPHPKTNAIRRAINPLNPTILKIVSSFTFEIFI